MNEAANIQQAQTVSEMQAIVDELSSLRRQRKQIDERIRAILGRVASDTDERPIWGPCTRCGHTWKGHWAGRPPRGCPRCGSTGWDRAPQTSRHRSPDDPPNPKWGKYKKRRQPELETRPPVATLRRLTPPPRPEDSMRRGMVPPPSVRFAEREAPQPESFVSGASSTVERGASIPEAAGSTPVSRSIEVPEELFEAVEGGGSITEDYDAS
jgi:predicted  nucleic acid-binding Zn-ribbon protein